MTHTTHPVKAISEFTLKPGQRDEFVRLFERLVPQHFEAMRAAGCHSATVYVVPGDPNKAIGIAEWESAAARAAVLSSDAMQAFAPLFEMMAAPPASTILERLR